MLFPSFSFLFLFLPFVVGGYYILPKNQRNTFLLLASIVFYGWDSPPLIGLLLGVIFLNYIGALAVDACAGRALKKGAVIIFIMSNLLCLGYFKYTNFLAEALSAIVSADWNIQKIILPLGLSFYIFQAMSYLIDVYRREFPAQRNPFKLALYISFFPQLVAGPIIKYHEIIGQINCRQERLADIHYGIRRFIVGLAKKVLIANALGGVVDKIFGLQVYEFDTPVAWLGIVCYTLQIYYDFSGYSDMAVGLGAVFGFRIPENFNYPLVSRSFTEFWRRWHISLGSWMKEYLYIPLGGSKCSTTRHYINLFIVFFVVGIWHGANWGSVLLGVCFGACIVLEKMLAVSKERDNFILNGLGTAYTFLLISIAWMVWRSPTLPFAFEYLKNLFGFISNHTIIHPFAYYVNHHHLLVLGTALACCAPVFKNMLRMKGILKNIAIDIWLILLFLLTIITLSASTYNPFIYFQF